MGIAYCKRGDTGIQFTNPREVAATATTPAIEHEPLMNDGVVVDLTGATIKFLLKMIDYPYALYSFTADIDGDPTAGDVVYIPGAGFPITPGQYLQEWEVTQADGSIRTFPQRGHNILVIEEDLNPDPFTILITDSDDSPIYDCQCWITTNADGTEPLTAVLSTNTAGEVNFYLPPGVYWLFREKIGLTFSVNPKEITIA